MSSYRIGNRTSPACANAITPESKILRALFELRRNANECVHSSSLREVIDVTFWNCRWSTRIVHSLRKLIVRDGKRFSTIKFFDCDINAVEFAEILAVILKNNAATSLVIKGGKLASGLVNGSNGPSPRSCESSFSVCARTFAALNEGMAVNTSLRSLQLSGLNFGKATTAEDSVDGNDHSVESSEATDDDSSRWCQALIGDTTIRQLNLSNSKLSALAVTKLSSALSRNTSLQSINLTHCTLEDRDLSKIIQSLKEHPSLVNLNLSRNFLGKSSSTSAMDAIAELLRSDSSKLESLDLSHQQRRPLFETSRTAEEREAEEAKHRGAFGNALQCLALNRSLRRIDMSGNSYCFADLNNVKALSSCLVANTGLSRVDISLCHLSPIGIQYLAQECIPYCSGMLKSLILFDDEDCILEKEEWASIESSLCIGLQSNTALETLGELGDSTVRTRGRNRTQHNLNLNRAGRRAFATDDLPPAVWPHVLARVGRLQYENNNDARDTVASMIFSLLQGPVLLER
jgi:hypothetical protein